MSDPTFDELMPSKKSSKTILAIKRKATEKGYELLKLMNEKTKWKNSDDRISNDKYLQIATSESLTCGLIMSTLVDIPWGGYMKYGGFGVYDTDAKRVFNKVSVDDVYTHKCASEMAIGVLKNSNATIAISVTGNAMPFNDHVQMLGEVFIGIAGYDSEGKIITGDLSQNYILYKPGTGIKGRYWALAEINGKPIKSQEEFEHYKKIIAFV
jgi:nicotinamide mononucleotide (NMN) deamidase PncC